MKVNVKVFVQKVSLYTAAVMAAHLTIKAPYKDDYAANENLAMWMVAQVLSGEINVLQFERTFLLNSTSGKEEAVALLLCSVSSHETGDICQSLVSGAQNVDQLWQIFCGACAAAVPPPFLIFLLEEMNKRLSFADIFWAKSKGSDHLEVMFKAWTERRYSGDAGEFAQAAWAKFPTDDASIVRRFAEIAFYRSINPMGLKEKVDLLRHLP